MFSLNNTKIREIQALKSNLARNFLYHAKILNRQELEGGKGGHFVIPQSDNVSINPSDCGPEHSSVVKPEAQLGLYVGGKKFPFDPQLRP